MPQTIDELARRRPYLFSTPRERATRLAFNAQKYGTFALRYAPALFRWGAVGVLGILFVVEPKAVFRYVPGKGQ